MPHGSATTGATEEANRPSAATQQRFRDCVRHPPFLAGRKLCYAHAYHFPQSRNWEHTVVRPATKRHGRTDVALHGTRWASASLPSAPRGGMASVDQHYCRTDHVNHRSLATNALHLDRTGNILRNPSLDGRVCVVSQKAGERGVAGTLAELPSVKELVPGDAGYLSPTALPTTTTWRSATDTREYLEGTCRYP
jgi:hypothetical protein